MPENFDKKIVVRLAGGLGNQIFQLGAGLLSAQKLGISKLILDDVALGNYKVKRTNNLIQFFDFSKSSISINFGENSFTKFRFGKLLPLKISYWPLMSDKNFQIIIESQKCQSRYLDGYFQDCLTQKNFDDIRKLLSRMFISKPFSYNKSACVIHIRGGDFVSLGWDKVNPPSYYHHAIEIMSNSHNVEQFVVVTDDIEYASRIMQTTNANYEIISNNIVSDFHAIASIDKRILSSSTFALWASALGQSKDQVVIASKLLRPDCYRFFSLFNEIDIA